MHQITKENLQEASNRLQNSKSILEIILIGSIYIENQLEIFLNQRLEHSQYLFSKGFNMSYNIKLKLALSLGFLHGRKRANDWSDLVSVYQGVGKIRNKFAHRLNYVLTKQDLAVLGYVVRFFPKHSGKELSVANFGKVGYVKQCMVIIMAFADLFARS